MNSSLTPPPFVSSSKKILIVDDDESMRATTKIILKAHGYEVSVAGDGREAIAKSQENFYHVVLLDITLPDIVGVDLIPYFKEANPETAIIMATAYATLETAIKAMNLGATAYITKPFNIDALLHTLRQTMEKQGLLLENQRLIKDLQTELENRIRVEQELLNTQNELEEKVKERTRQLTIANQELEQFVYSSYHDLRSPVRAIKLYAELALKGTSYSSPLPDETNEYLQTIVSESDRLFKLLDSILIHGRLGQYAEQLQPVSLLEALYVVLVKFQPYINEIQAEIELPNDDAFVMGNPNLLSQIFTNLLDNALKYRLPDTKTKVIFQIREIDGYIGIDVSDNGIGIPSEYFHKIFQIFQRLHTIDEYPGAGIGLATVKKSVDLLNGTIYVSSVVNKGTTFHLRIPKAS